MRVRTLFAGLVVVAVVAGAACTPPPPTGTLDAVAISCWGDNYHRQLGPGSLFDSSVPGGAVDLTAGSSYSCAVLDDRSAGCWGRNYEGQLGDGTTIDSSVPVRVVAG